MNKLNKQNVIFFIDHHHHRQQITQTGVLPACFPFPIRNSAARSARTVWSFCSSTNNSKASMSESSTFRHAIVKNSSSPSNPGNETFPRDLCHSAMAPKGRFQGLRRPGWVTKGGLLRGRSDVAKIPKCPTLVLWLSGSATWGWWNVRVPSKWLLFDKLTDGNNNNNVNYKIINYYN